MRILLIEDDAVLQGLIARSLRDSGHRVDCAGYLDEAEHLWRFQSYDSVLLDLNVPPSQSGHCLLHNGLSLLRQARLRGDKTPVLILTARNRTDERIAGLDAGADDYLGKPFDLAEVEARLRALVRRAHATHDVVTIGTLTFDRRQRRFWLGQEALNLPAREFEVLAELMTPPGRTVSKRSLSHKLSTYDIHLLDNALEAFISRLRKKLSGSGANIRTLRGIGYVLEASTTE